MGIARRVVSVALIVLTALTALLWAWPKFGDGGFLWALSVPAGVGITYLVHLLTAPRRSRRSIWVPIGIIAVLAMLWFGGLIVATLASPIETPTDTPSDQIMLLLLVMLLWPFLIAGGLLVLLVLKVGERIGNRTATSKKQAGRAPGTPAMPLTHGSPSIISGSSPPSAPVQMHNSFSPSEPSQTRTHSATSAIPGPVPGSSDGINRDPNAPDATPAGTRDHAGPVATGIPLQELSTLAEVAVSLGQDDASSALTLEIGGSGITVSADGVPLGSVNCVWTGSAGASATALASEVLHGLRSFAAQTARITIIPGATEISNLEFRAVGSDQRFTVRSFTA
ncbi:hypothetical protein ACT3UL_06995 [Brachybacterium sp. 107]